METLEKKSFPSWSQDADSNSLTTDNLERHGQMNHQTSLPDGGALLSEAKLQSIMSFLDEMETSEQERPRSITSGSQREVQNVPPPLASVSCGGVLLSCCLSALLSGAALRGRAAWH